MSERFAGLRPRLTLFVALLVIACLAIAFAAVYRTTQHELTRRTDADLRPEMAALAVGVAPQGSAPAGVAERARSFLARQPFRSISHVLYVDVPGAPPVTNEPRLAAGAAAAEIAAAPLGSSFRTLPQTGRVRLLVREVPVGDGTTARLAVGEPTAARDRALDVIAEAFLVAGALAVAVALAGGFLVASRVVAPLRRMAGVAAQVDAGDLTPRMEIRHRRDEVRVLADSFDHMLDRVQQGFDRQAGFVADASHELRTPLTVIRGQLEVLALDPDPDPQEVRRVERIVGAEVDRMDRLVEDLLLLARADEGEAVRRAPIDLPDFLADLLDGLRSTAERRFELGEVPAVVIDADPDRLAQVVRNVLRNAATHTTAGGLVRLSAQAGAGDVRIIVDDDGPGIPEADRARVFDRFHRLDAGRSRHAGGSGLGLAIVQAVARSHGGRAWAEASPQGGARIVIAMPRSAPS